MYDQHGVAQPKLQRPEFIVRQERHLQRGCRVTVVFHSKTIAIGSKSIEGTADEKPASASPPPAPESLPSELGFIRLRRAAVPCRTQAAALARRQAITPEAALLATGSATDTFYYHALARHLGVDFITGEAELGAGARYPHSIHAGPALK